MATSSRLFIGNLNYKTNAETIGHLFETIGGVDNVKTSSKNGKSLGYGFIEMADVEQAQKAQFQLNRYILDGRQIRVEFAKERKMKKFQNSSKLNKINRSYDNMHIEKNAIPKYQQDQLHQIMQDIQSIIESETINDDQKVIKIREIYNELKKKDKNELRKIFNIDAFKLIQYYINDCRSGIKKILLDIIEFIAEHVIQIYFPQDRHYPIFDNVQSSGLIAKIEQIIKDKIEEEKEQIKYSDEIEQLIRIYIQIMKRRESDQEMIDTCIKVIEKNLINLLISINKLKEENNKGNINETNNEESKREIKQSSTLIKVCSLIREKDPNWDNQTRIPDQIMKIMKERINPLIHLNCPPDINCSQYFNVPQSSTIIELKSAVIQSLNEVSWINQGFKEILVNDYNIIPHLIPPLIQFASQSQFNKKTNSIQQYNQKQSESSSSISLITSSINLLNNLIQNSNNNKCQEVINTPKVLHSLTTLSIYKIGTHFNQENDQQTFALRSGNIGCLWYIQFFADASVQSELVNANYTGVLVITVSTASGHGEEYDNEIYWGLDQISNFLRCLNKWKYYNATFPPQPLLARRADEQIEEEGGNEEIDSQQKNKAFSCNIKDNANRAKGSIFNYFIEQVNTRLSWY